MQIKILDALSSLLNHNYQQAAVKLTSIQVVDPQILLKYLT